MDMLYYSQILLFLLLCLHKVNSRYQLSEGSRCKWSRQHGVYTCKKLKDCNVKQMINDNDRPSLCSYSKMSVVVCCRSDSVISYGNLKSQRLVNIQERTFKTISEKKCDEYKKHVFQKPAMTVLSIVPDEEEKKENTCAAREKPLIIDGEPTGFREFPHQVRIGYKYQGGLKWGCGGSLISENFVLSAAHCSNTKYGKPRFALLGSLAGNSENGNPRDVYNINEIINHNLYNDYIYNDIALYKLDRNVKFDKHKRPACISTEQLVNVSRAVATGWGSTTKQGGAASSSLQKVNLDLISNNVCNTFWPRNKLFRLGVVESMILCAGDLKGKKDTCSGDSGGPLQILLKDPYCMYAVIGITSHGQQCGEKIPGLYTRVSNYREWIEKIVWPNERI